MCIKSLKKAVKPYVIHKLSDTEIVHTFGLNEGGMIKQLVGNENWKDALKDFYAVYNNGVLEGTVNKLKSIKRQIFNRLSTELLNTKLIAFKHNIAPKVTKNLRLHLTLKKNM